jgi:hypothetical protein
VARKAGRAEPARYDHAEVEPRWQRFWSEHATFRAVRRPGREKRYVLEPHLDTRLDGRNQSGQYTATTLAFPTQWPQHPGAATVGT